MGHPDGCLISFTEDIYEVVLLIQLKYKDRRHEFAVPFRSNIPPATPKNEYFALPPRKTTREKHRHGIHYSKMVPVKNEYFERYRIEGDIASKMYLAIIDKNEKEIVDGCQEYLNRYSAGEKRPMQRISTS